MQLLAVIPLLAVGCQATAQAEVSRCQNAFLETGELQHNPLFKDKKAFRYHTSSLFRHMADAEQAEAFFQYGRKHKLLSMVTKKDISESSEAVCQVMGHYLRDLSGALGGITEGCLAVMLNHMGLEDFHHLPNKLLESHAKYILASQPRLNYYKSSQIRVIVASSSACRYASAASVSKLSSSQLKELTPRCFAELDGLDKADLSHQVGDMKKDMFSYVRCSLNSHTVESMSKGHVAYYASKTRNYKYLGLLDLHHLDKRAASGVTSEMFLQYLKRQSRLLGGKITKRSLRLGKMWKHLPDGILRKSRLKKHLVTIAKALSSQDLRHMKAAQINDLIASDPKVCTHLPSRLRLSKNVLNKIKISAKCFANLARSNQMGLLTSGAKLEENILGKITHKHASRWTQGIRFLNKIKAPNANEILSNASKGVEDDKHICRAIKDVRTLKDLKIFRKSMPHGCWDSLGFKVSEKHVSKYPLLFAGRKHVLKRLFHKSGKNPKAGAAFIKKLSQPELMRLTAEHGEECHYMTLSTFRQIASTKLKGLSPTCIAHLSFKDQLMPEEIQNLSDRAFASIDKDNVAGLHVGWLLNSQLENLSADADQASVASAAFTAQTMNEITEERFQFLPARLWASMPFHLFASFQTIQAFSTFPGVKMIYWDSARIKAIRLDVIYALNVDHASQIGLESQDLPALGQFFSQYMGNFSPAVQDVLQTRFGIPAVTSKSGASRTSLCSLSAILISCASLYLL